MSGLEGAALSEMGKKAAIGVGSSMLASEANKALGRTQKSGIQASQISPAISNYLGKSLAQLEEERKRKQMLDSRTLNYNPNKFGGYA
jgi:hypothetical protein